MVPRADNRTINTRFRSDNDSISTLTPGQALIEILREHENIIHDTRKDQIDVNNWGDDPALGTITVENPVRLPVLITDIFATWAPIPTSGSSASGTGAVTTPGAFANIASTAALPPGEYNVYVDFSMAGTPAQGTDNDNIRISFAGNNIQLANNIGTAEQTFGPILIRTNSTANALLQTIGAGTAGSIYEGTITAVPVNGTATIVFGGRTFQLNYATGFFNLTSLHGLQWEYQGAGGNNMVLTVSPAVAAHLEFAGTADYRKLERL